MSALKTVFVIDDDRRDRDMLSRAISSCDHDLHVQTFSVLEDSYAPILKTRPGCIVLDDYMGHLNALDTLPFMRRMSMGGKIIIVSNTTLGTRRGPLLEAGCADYLLKCDIDDHPRLLGDAIAKVLLSGKQAAAERLSRPTLFDTLPELKSLPPLERWDVV